MAIFQKPKQIPKPPEVSKDAWWSKVDKLTAKLHKKWGLGTNRSDAGYRNRLKRLCEFLRGLEEETVTAGQVEFARYDLLLSPSYRWRGAREVYIQRLEDLRAALEPLGKVAGQAAETCLKALQTWPPPIESLAPLDGESSEDHEARRDNLRKALQTLQALPVDPAKPKKALAGCLRALGKRLASPPATAGSGAEAERLQEVRSSWSYFVESCFGDWEWAYLQVLVRLAQECLR